MMECLKHWSRELGKSGVNSKSQVKDEINKVIEDLEAEGEGKITPMLTTFHYSKKDNMTFERDIIGDVITKYTENLLFEVVGGKEKYLLDNLYKAYLNITITDLFVLNEEEFKEFLLKYLPIREIEKRKQQ